MAEAYHTQESKKWERTRLLCSMIHNVNCTKRSQMIKPQDVVNLPIDNLLKKKSYEPKGDLQMLKKIEEKFKNAKWVPVNKL